MKCLFCLDKSKVKFMYRSAIRNLCVVDEFGNAFQVC